MEKLLEQVLEYQITDKTQIKALKIAEMYREISRKYFPNYNHDRKNSKDPRKSSLFKYCLKLITDFSLDDKDYFNYITAQMQILKKINLDNKNPLISCNCLVGEQAWKRWLLWKKYYLKKEKEIESADKVIDIHKNVIKELEETKKYLADKKDYLGNKKIFWWCSLGLCSPYFLFHEKILQYVQKYDIKLLDFGIDMKFFEKGITDEVKDWLKVNFNI